MTHPVGSRERVTSKQIRGSSLLLVGKVAAMGINLLTHVLMVRYLSKTDFGAWGYAIALVSFFKMFCTLGLGRSLTRFIPIYHEKEEFDKLFGTIVLALTTIFSTSLVIVTAVYLAPELISKLIAGEAQPVALLLIMIFLVPIDAIDRVFEGLFASFINPKVIFFRKYVLAPILRLTVVCLLILLGSTVTFIAYGYVIASVLGVLLYVGSFFRLMQKERMGEHLRRDRIRVPFKEVFAFTIPLMTSDILTVVMHTTDTIFLGYFHDSTAIASYQVVLPAARINVMVLTSFGYLFTPLAARLFAKGDKEGINNLYWRTAAWLAVLSFPMFALTFSLGQPLTLLLYGERYADSWLYLSLLGFAYYFNAALGFNGLTLKVIGKVKYIMCINLVTAVLNVIANLLLIPLYGALGATIATAGSMIVHNCLKQMGLKWLGGLQVFDWSFTAVYLVIFGAGAGLLVIQQVFQPQLLIMLVLAACASFGVLRFCQDKLDVQTNFPELLKIPFLGKILGVRSPAPPAPG